MKTRGMINFRDIFVIFVLFARNCKIRMLKKMLWARTVIIVGMKMVKIRIASYCTLTGKGETEAKSMVPVWWAPSEQ